VLLGHGEGDGWVGGREGGWEEECGGWVGGWEEECGGSDELDELDRGGRPIGTHDGSGGEAYPHCLHLPPYLNETSTFPTPDLVPAPPVLCSELEGELGTVPKSTPPSYT
jgi:hypothetical protein